MSAIATVLAMQVAVADDVKSSDGAMGMQQQHDLAKTNSQARHEAKNVAGNVRVSLDAVMDFQVVKPTNEKRYTHSSGDKYSSRLYDANMLVTKPADAKAPVLQKDHDAGILGDYSKDYYFGVDGMLNMKIERSVLHNMSVGAALEVATPASSSRVRDYSVGAKQKGAYVFLKTPYLNGQVGSMIGAEQVMRIDSTVWSAADGGVAGNWISYANLEGNYADAVVANTTTTPNTKARLSADVLRPFYVTPALYSQYISDDATFSRYDDVSIAPKVAIYSHKIAGFQVGASYAPHHSYGYGSNATVKSHAANYDDVIGVGARYSKDFDEFAVQTAVAAEMGSAVKGSEYNDLFAFSVGGLARYKNMFTVGGEYGNLGKSGVAKKMHKDVNLSIAAANPEQDTKPDVKRNYYWTIGGAYDFGPARLSAGYFKSFKNPYSSESADDSTVEDFNVAAHYNFSYGSKQAQFAPYVSYHNFTTKERVRTLVPGETGNPGTPDITIEGKDNKGHLLMVGVKTVF